MSYGYIGIWWRQATYSAGFPYSETLWQSYSTYLGAIFTADGNTQNSLALHVKEKTKHLTIFLSTNYYAPFCVKRKVF